MTDSVQEPMGVLINSIENDPKRIAVYAGSFDPPTKGHWDIIKRASTLFDEVIVAVGTNAKKTPFMTTMSRVQVLSDLVSSLPNCKSDCFEGLLADYARHQNACAIIRGLRPNGDFDNEFLLASGNKDLAPEIETVWLATGTGHSFISSSLVREVGIMSNDDRWQKWVPEEIVDQVSVYIDKARS